MGKLNTKELCIKALLIALVAVATMVITVPVPATSGYVHLGDSVIFIVSVFFGWEYGLVAAALGSAFADVFLGYVHWVPFTLIIKGFMGYAVGKIANYKDQRVNFFTKRNLMAVVIGMVIMVAGYLIGGTILKGNFYVALTSVPGNLVQGAGGIIFYLVVGGAFHKAKVYKYLQMK